MIVEQRDRGGDGHEELVVVLGAGFSRAVHRALPTTDNLGERVREQLADADRSRLPGAPFRDGRFEEWLSYLAEDQPHLTEDKSLEAQALLRRVVRTIHHVLSEAQVEALASEAPRWLFELLSVFHGLRATVITLNYDNLVECCVENHHRASGPYVKYTHMTVDEDSILDGLPRRADLLERRETALAVSQMAAIGNRFYPLIFGTAPGPESFRLLKLHGSLSWPGGFGRPEPVDDEDRHRLLPGLKPFVVPPAALKSAYLRNPTVREMWWRASQAPRRARRVVLVGYSVPRADGSMTGMLVEALAGNALTVEVVNLDPGPTITNLERLGIPASVPPGVEGEHCVASWVSAEVDKLARHVVHRLRGATGLNGEERLLVAHNGGASAVTSVTPPSRPGGETILITPSEPYPLSNSLPSKDLLERIEDSCRVAVEVDGRPIPVITRESNPRSAVGVHGQIYLVPAGEW